MVEGIIKFIAVVSAILTIWHFLKIFTISYTPRSFSPLERSFAEYHGQGAQAFGAMFFAIGAFSCLWGLYNTMFPPQAPSKAINVADFSSDDLSWELNEVFLDGYLHPNEIIRLTVPRRVPIAGQNMIFNRNFELLPLAGKNWTRDDPVKALVNFGQSTDERTPEEWKKAFLSYGLSLDNPEIIKVHAILVTSNIPNFSHHTVKILRESGWNISDDVVALEFVGPYRDQNLKNRYEGFQYSGARFAVIGAVFFGIGSAIKAALRRAER